MKTTSAIKEILLCATLALISLPAPGSNIRSEPAASNTVGHLIQGVESHDNFIVQNPGYVLQLAAHRSLVNASAALADLDAPGAVIVSTRVNREEIYVILGGSYSSRPDALSAANAFDSKNPGADYWVRASGGLLEALDGQASTTDTRNGHTDKSRVDYNSAKNDAKQRKALDRSPVEITARPQKAAPSKSVQGGLTIEADDLWLEYGAFPDSDSRADRQEYLHGQATIAWSGNNRWEAQLSARVDGYYQQGDSDTDSFELDYEESYFRYTESDLRVTLGTQKILWGRIDEFPPTDRLSTQDVSRYILDDLADRRRASPAARFEYYLGNSKLDFMVLPFFREAELPDKKSTWFPIDQDEGRIFGRKTTAASAEIVKNAVIDLDDPDTDGGVGLRYSGLTRDLDYGLSVQRGRHNLPYFTYNPQKQTIEARYPRTWIIGGDIGFEVWSGTMRLEATWLSDTPVTSLEGQVSNVQSVTWGGGFEFFPGDGDARINLQLIGNRLFDASRVFDRDEAYSFSGSFESPFANDSWRFKTRFHFGLDEKDIYVNPELAFTGWSSQELYLESHFFDGSDGTPGGFHQDHSLITMGWRNRF